MGDALTAARTWLRECPLIDKNDRFNVNYLGDRAVEYALTLASETHKEDVCGYDIATYNMVFLARLPFGAHMGTNIASAELFSGLSRWIRAQNRTRRYPTGIDGYHVERVSTANAGVIVTAGANTSEYQLQIQLILEEA